MKDTNDLKIKTSVYEEVNKNNRMCQKWFVNFILDIFSWMMLNGQVD